MSTAKKTPEMAAGEVATSEATTANKPAAPAPGKPERHVEALQPIRMKSAEFARNIYVGTAHANTNIPDLLEASYFAHVASQLKPWDKIEMRADDGTWYCECLVLEVGRGWARVTIINEKDLSSTDVAQSQAIRLAGYEIQYRGEFLKWSVIRSKDRQVVREELGSQGSALDWLNERLKADR